MQIMPPRAEGTHISVFENLTTCSYRKNVNHCMWGEEDKDVHCHLKGSLLMFIQLHARDWVNELSELC